MHDGMARRKEQFTRSRGASQLIVCGASAVFCDVNVASPEIRAQKHVVYFTLLS